MSVGTSALPAARPGRDRWAGEGEPDGGLGPELAAALRACAELARRSGRFELAGELEARLAPAPALQLQVFGSQPRLILARPGPAAAGGGLAAQALLRHAGSPGPSKRPAGHPRSLVEALWGEESAEAIRRNFHPVLSDLRRTLQETLAQALGRREDMLAFHLGVYRLDAPLPLEVDAESFEARVAEGEAAHRRGDGALAMEHLLAAWKLYHGPLLDGFEGEWLRHRREELHRRYLEALRRVGAMAAAGGEDLLAVDAFRSLLFAEPFDEGCHLELMRLYARSGRRDLVRRQFVRLSGKPQGARRRAAAGHPGGIPPAHARSALV